MKINSKHRTHGAALAQIVEHESFTALNRASEKNGHYQVNKDRRLLVKKASTGPEEWRFTFTEDNIDALNQDLGNGVEAFVCLVCGDETVCVLGESEIEEVIDLDRRSPQSVVVETPARRSMRVRGTNGELNRTVPHNAFPEIIFN
jgi:hypothetical protein